jgi:hypothetical protein
MGDQRKPEAFWKKNAEEEVKKAVAQADTAATVEADGAIRWNSNGRYLMDDFCEKLEYAGYPFSREATAKKRGAQDEESLDEYRKKPQRAWCGGACGGKGSIWGRHNGCECADRRKDGPLRHRTFQFHSFRKQAIAQAGSRLFHTQI